MRPAHGDVSSARARNTWLRCCVMAYEKIAWVRVALIRAVFAEYARRST